MVRLDCPAVISIDVIRDQVLLQNCFSGSTEGHVLNSLSVKFSSAARAEQVTVAVALLDPAKPSPNPNELAYSAAREISRRAAFTGYWDEELAYSEAGFTFQDITSYYQIK